MAAIREKRGIGERRAFAFAVDRIQQRNGPARCRYSGASSPCGSRGPSRDAGRYSPYG